MERIASNESGKPVRFSSVESNLAKELPNRAKLFVSVCLQKFKKDSRGIRFQKEISG